MSEQSRAQRLVKLVSELQLAEPTPEVLAELQDLLRDEGARRLYIELTNLQNQLESLHTRRAAEHLDGQGDSEEILAMLQQADDETTEALAELARLHEEGLKQPVRLRMRRKKQAEPQVFTADVRRRLSPKWIATGSLAAAIAIAGLTVLVVSLFSQLEADIAEQPTEAAEFVATLTAVQDARWEAESGTALPDVGDELYPEQQLILTEGFAEITTSRGAIAVIEAPATIQFLDNDNALRLEAGKLVGICETETSKGFLVRTPHMDIIDLGTRFGIDADADATEVHVFEGEVQAARTDATPGTEPTRLAAAQSARASADTRVVAVIDHEAQRFAELLPTTIELPGTGQGLAVGDTDPNWRVVAVNGKALAPPLPLVVDNVPSHTLHTPNQPGRAQWISYISSGDDWGADTSRRYVFETAINIPRAFDTASGQLELSFVADNRLVGMQVNGQPVEVPGNNLSSHTRPAFKMIVTDLLLPGKNTIRFEVYDAVVQIPDAINHAGLWVAWRLVTDQTDTTNPTNPGGIE